MKRLLPFLTVLLALWIAPAQADEAGTGLEPLLEQLTQVKLKNTQPLLEKLESTGGERMLPIFSRLLNGQLYYIKADRRLIAVIKADGETR